MLEIKKKVITVNYEGAQYKVRAPSNRELKEFESSIRDREIEFKSSLKDSDDESDKSSIIALEETIKLLDLLGIPSAIGWDMDPESLATIVEHITPKKKTLAS